MSHKTVRASLLAFKPLLLLALFISLSRCSTYVPVAGGDNFAYLYGKGAAAIRLQARVYHASNDRSVIWFKLRTADLLYKSSGEGGPFRAKVLIKYEAWSTWGSEQMLDSSSTFVRDTGDRPDDDKDLIGSIDMKRNDQRSFLLKVTARDMNRNSESTVFIPVERTSVGQRQNFLPVDHRGIPIFDDNIPLGDTARVLCEQCAGTTLIAEHIVHDMKLPPPVFTQVDGKTMVRVDTSSQVPVAADGYFTHVATRTGFTHYRPTMDNTTGFSLFTYAPPYPVVVDHADMVAPLRYITSLQEWDRITGSTDKRKEVEKFWIDAAGGRDRAREAIAAYYSRVESANRYFTSWTEGWKTDRGLVHIIFGTPNTIRKNAGNETWIYGEENSMMSLVFVFDKRDGPYSDNDLVLRREGIFKSAWYRNVESWRNGRVVQN